MVGTHGCWGRVDDWGQTSMEIRPYFTVIEITLEGSSWRVQKKPIKKCPPLPILTLMCGHMTEHLFSGAHNLLRLAYLYLNLSFHCLTTRPLFSWVLCNNINHQRQMLTGRKKIQQLLWQRASECPRCNSAPNQHNTINTYFDLGLLSPHIFLLYG